MNDTPICRWSWWRALLILFVFATLSGIAGEIGIRLRDRIVNGTPFLANPTYNVLRMRRFGIWVGRPNAHFQKWKLNAYGFRSEPIAFTKRPGCTRVMVIGASEMFGLYEAPHHDFVADLTRDLKPHGCFEIINAAMAGMGLGSENVYWTHYLVRFKPDWVLIYPVPDIDLIIYLKTHGRIQPARAATHKITLSSANPMRSRLLDYLRGFIHMPERITDWRTRRGIDAQIAAHPAGWRLRHVPQGAQQRYARGLGRLVAAIENSGAKPILMTHALRVTPKSVFTDTAARLWLLSEGPRATAHTWVQNDVLANEKLKALARAEHLPIIHLSRKLSGCRPCFFDAAHFTTKGAERAAAIAAQTLVPLSHKFAPSSSLHSLN